MSARPVLSLLGQRLLPAAERRAVLRQLRRVLRAAALGPVEIGVVFVNDFEMRALNRAWRHRDEPTDVLSFSAQEGEAMPGADAILGDLVISVDTARRQARALGHSLDLEIAVLMVHGICHLGGLDHERSDGEAKVQLACEQTLLGCAGLNAHAGLVNRALGGVAD